MQFLLDPLNGSANRAVISDGIAIVDQTNAFLQALKAEIDTSANINGTDTRMERLRNVHWSFQSAVINYQIALRKYKSDIESAFRGDVLAKLPVASTIEIDAAIANAVGLSRTVEGGYAMAVQEIGDAKTNSVAIEIMPKYPDLIILVETLDALMRSLCPLSTFFCDLDGAHELRTCCSRKD